MWVKYALGDSNVTRGGWVAALLLPAGSRPCTFPWKVLWPFSSLTHPSACWILWSPFISTIRLFTAHAFGWVIFMVPPASRFQNPLAFTQWYQPFHFPFCLRPAACCLDWASILSWLVPYGCWNSYDKLSDKKTQMHYLTIPEVSRSQKRLRIPPGF